MVNAWPDDGYLTLQGRYKIAQSKVLGEGSNAIVYQGLDIKACQKVAVKVFKGSTQDESSEKAVQLFRKTVEVLEAITSAVSARRVKVHASGARLSVSSFDCGCFSEDLSSFRPVGSNYSHEPEAAQVLGAIDWSDCFAQLLAHSRDHKGHPGRDSDVDLFFLIFEAGEESLDNRLQEYQDNGKSFTPSELRDLQWALVTIVCGLHIGGFVHMDIKPCNIMSFEMPDNGRSQWKLIDLDGALRTGSLVDIDECVFTPLYMPPELAKGCIDRIGGSSSTLRRIKVSRLMDVWSIGMCALEAIFFQPVLQPWYLEWAEETSNNVKFFTWLANYSLPMMEGDMKELIAHIDADMCNMIVCMLEKDPDKRISITECLAHPWFRPIRAQITSHGYCSSRHTERSSTNMNHSGRLSIARSIKKSRACSTM